MKKFTPLFSLVIALILTSCEDSKNKKDFEMNTCTWDEIINDRNLDHYLSDDNLDKSIVIIMAPETAIDIEYARD